MYVYLDTWAISSLHNAGEDAPIVRKFAAVRGKESVWLVLSLFHIYETISYGEPRRSRRIKSIELLDTTQKVKWLAPRFTIELKEVKRFFYRDRKLEYKVNPFYSRLCDAVSDEIDGPAGLSLKGFGFGETTMLFKTNPKLVAAAGEFGQAKQVWPEQMKIVREIEVTQDMLRRATVGLIKDLLPYELPFGVPVSKSMRTDFLRRVSESRELFRELQQQCPTVDTQVRLIEQIRRNIGDTRNYLLDIFHIAALPYCDVIVTDGPMRDYLRRCNLAPHLIGKCFDDLDAAFNHVLSKT